MKQELIEELKKNFKLPPEAELNNLKKNKEAMTIKGLVALIEGVNDPTTSPKEIAQRLENVIVCIAINNTHATPLEKSLQRSLESFQNKLASGEIDFQERTSSFSLRQ